MHRKALQIILAAAIFAGVPAFAQQGAPAAAQPPRTAKSVAPIDVTGYWMSMVVDEWRFRVTPQKGDIPYMPTNAEARKIALAWDPAKDEVEGKACKAYG